MSAEPAEGWEEPPFGFEELSAPSELAGISDAGLLYAASLAKHEALSASKSAADCGSALKQACCDKKREAAELEARHKRERALFQRVWRRKLKTLADKSNAATSLAIRADEKSAAWLHVVEEKGKEQDGEGCDSPAPAAEERGVWEVMEEQVRSLARSDLQHAREVDRQAALLRQENYERILDAKSAGGGCEVQSLEEPIAAEVAEEELLRTMKWVWNNPAHRAHRPRDVFEMFEIESRRDPRETPPEDVSRTVLEMVRFARSKLQTGHAVTLHEGDVAKLEAVDDTEEVAGVVSWVPLAWQAIALSVRTQWQQDTARMRAAREKPREDSADIAIFNKSAHFAWQSEEAHAAEHPLDNALRHCRLRSRPLEYKSLFGAAEAEVEEPPRGALPFEIAVYYCQVVDVEGNTVACAGDLRHNSVRDSQNYVGCFEVPVPSTPLSAARHRDELMEYDSNPTRLLACETRDRSDCYFNTVLAEHERGVSRVWAVDTSATSAAFTVHGFDCERRVEVARLAFPGIVRKISGGGHQCGLTRCGDCIVGTGGDASLHVWSVREALEAFEREGGDTSSKIDEEWDPWNSDWAADVEIEEEEEEAGSEEGGWKEEKADGEEAGVGRSGG